MIHIEHRSNIHFAQAANTKVYIQIGHHGWWIGRGWFRALRVEVFPRPGVWFRLGLPAVKP